MSHLKMQSSKGTYCPSDDELRRARQLLRSRERIYDQPHARLSKECSSPPPTGPEYYNQIMITYLRSKESQHGTEQGGAMMMPPGAKPIPLPKPKKPTNDNTDNRRFSPTGFPTQEEGENIYDQPNTSVECSSPPPTGTEYYNKSAILRHHQSQYGTQGNAVIPMPPSAARARPTPPPKPQKPTNDHKHTDDVSTSYPTSMQARQTWY